MGSFFVVLVSRCFSACDIHALVTRRLTMLVLIASVLWTLPAGASGPMLVPKGVFLPTGINLGGSIDRIGGSGFVLGGETSVVAHDGNWLWYGGYLDANHDFGASETRLSIGPELGYTVLGLDGGYMLLLDGGAAKHALVVRPVLTLGILSGYFRSGWLLDGQGDWFGEAGVLLKYPIPIDAPGWD